MTLLRRPSVQVVLSGAVIWALLDWATVTSKNPNLVPSLILVGAALGPVAFTAYVYERAREVPLYLLMWCFLVGGALGVVAASVLEFRTLLDLRALPTIAIGLIEESCKLVIPLLIFFAFPRFRREADGLLFGVASGLGFAAFESMGYGLTALLRSGGNIGATEQMLFVRTVLSPAGHGAWTGLICAALWRAREGGSSWVMVPIAFVVAVVLHALWDSVQHPWQQSIIAVISFSLLIWRLRAASEPRPAARRAWVDFRPRAPLTP